jgi:hypothetical protein
VTFTPIVVFPPLVAGVGFDVCPFPPAPIVIVKGVPGVTG